MEERMSILKPALRLSLAQRLSLLTGVVVACCLVIALGATYEVLRRSAIAGMDERLLRATRQLASSAAIAIRQSRSRYATAAADSALRGLVADTAGPERGVATVAADSLLERARRALAGLANAADSGLAIELWNAHNHRVTFVRPGAPALTVFGPIDTASLQARRVLLDALGTASSESLRVSRLYVSGGRVYFWVVQPIVGETGLLGYIAHERRIAPNSQTDTTIRALTGPGVSTYYANDDGTVWTTVGGQPVTPHWHTAGEKSGRAVDGTGAQVLIARAAIAGTPLEILIESQVAAVLGLPLSTIRELCFLGLFLMFIGMGAALLIGRRVSDPIVAIATAAQAIARGQYDVRVPDGGNGEAEEEVARLAASFNHMAKEVAAAEETRREIAHMGRVAAVAELAASISHELRQPLTAIRASAESGLLLLERAENDPVQEEEVLRSIIEDCERAAGVIDHMRLLLRKEHPISTIVDVNEICREVVHLLRQDAALRRIALELSAAPAPLFVAGDSVQLQQVILNLALNALDASSLLPSPRKVAIQTMATGSVVQVAVRDHGPGIEPEQRRRLFEPFFTTKSQGLGMGLAIVRSIVERHDGRVSAENAYGGGALFTVTLPSLQAEAGAGRYRSNRLTQEIPSPYSPI